jgi:hypothetical protein
MAHSIAVTAYGSRVTLRSPFVLTFRLPRLLVEHSGKAVVFGEANGLLGFNPLGAATVEDVTIAIDEYPRVPLFALHTEHLSVPMVANAKVFSTPAETAWPFELQLENPAHADEMMHVRGPLPSPLDLSKGPPSMTPVAEGAVAKRNGESHWREWEYSFDARPWRQRLYDVALASTHQLGARLHFTVTAQCPLERREPVFAFADRLTADLASTS